MPARARKTPAQTVAEKVDPCHLLDNYRLIRSRSAVEAGVSPRTPEASFRHRYDQPPRANWRGVRLQRARAAMRSAATEGCNTSATGTAPGSRVAAH